MEIAITNVQPNPIHVLANSPIPVTVTVIATKDFSNAKMVITNKQTAAAELFDSNEHSDQIRSNLVNLKPGSNFVIHTMGFELQPSQKIGGAIIGIVICFEDQNGQQISQEVPVLVSIGAH